jgi:hypothetical protein
MSRRSNRVKQQGVERAERGGEAERGTKPQRQWRVFEYRQPRPARPRFTT